MNPSNESGGLNSNIGQFVIPNLNLNICDSSPSQPSLSALADAHLSQNPIKLDFGAPFASQNQANKSSEPDLQALANLHLDSTSNSSSGFQIPSLFGNESFQQKIEIKPQEEDTKDSKVNFIDLSAALQTIPVKPAPKPKIVEPVIEEPVVKNLSDIELLIPIDFWEKENEKVPISNFSALGKVICRKWISRQRPKVLQRKSSNICNVDIFKFDTPSPDAIVREAQKQAFGRKS